MSHSARENLKPVMTFELMKLPRELRIMLRDRIYGHMVVRDQIKITTTLLLLQHSADATNNIREVCIDDEIEASTKATLSVCIHARLRRSRRTPRNRVRQVHHGLLKDLNGPHLWETYRISEGVTDPPLLDISLENVQIYKEAASGFYRGNIFDFALRGDSHDSTRIAMHSFEIGSSVLSRRFDTLVLGLARFLLPPL